MINNNNNTSSDNYSDLYNLKHGLKETKNNLYIFFKWLFLAVISGITIGIVASIFSKVLGMGCSYRESHTWLVMFLPFAGIFIVFIYEKFGKEDRGTNQIIGTIKETDDAPLISAPLIFISTIITHLFGGSAGREGAAIQLGGSLGNRLGKIFKLDKEDRHVIVMCGMCASFSAVFGTPIAATIFSMEISSVGILYYTALFPCIISGIVASAIAGLFGLHGETFIVSNIPSLGLKSLSIVIILGLLCALVSVLFCYSLGLADKIYKRYFKNPYIRITFASVLFIIITIILGTADYMGSGSNLILKAIEEGITRPEAFIMKIILTAIIMKAGFKGGEIVPSFSIGATFGCLFGTLLGFSPSFMAACAMVAVFCGVTNCPLTSAFLAFEMFGFEGAPFYAVIVAVSYAASGYYSLYKTQTITYSKYKAKYVGRDTIE